LHCDESAPGLDATDAPQHPRRTIFFGKEGWTVELGEPVAAFDVDLVKEDDCDPTKPSATTWQARINL
jgi:hypothetical protein